MVIYFHRYGVYIDKLGLFKFSSKPTIIFLHFVDQIPSADSYDEEYNPENAAVCFFVVYILQIHPYRKILNESVYKQADNDSHNDNPYVLGHHRRHEYDSHNQSPSCSYPRLIIHVAERQFTESYDTDAQSHNYAGAIANSKAGKNQDNNNNCRNSDK